MEDKLDFSFDDEVVTKFCYDMDHKRIEIHFSRYFDTIKNIPVKKTNTLIIENWLEAASKKDQSTKSEPLDNNIGVISMILYLKITNENLDLYVNTIDNRYVNLAFTKPKISFITTE